MLRIRNKISKSIDIAYILSYTGIDDMLIVTVSISFLRADGQFFIFFILCEAGECVPASYGRHKFTS